MPASLLIWLVSWVHFTASITLPFQPRPHPVAPAHARSIAPMVRVIASRMSIGFEFPASDDEEEEAEQEQLAKSTITIPSTPAANMTVDELKACLKTTGNRVAGTRAELIKRVQVLQRKQLLGLPLNELEVQKQADMRWFMLQTANGFERAVERNLNMMIKTNRLSDRIDQVFVPILEGASSVRESSVMPSYIFVRMLMDPRLHTIITEMQYVISFVGADRGGRSMSGQMAGNRGFVQPMPMSEAAFEKIVKLTQAKRLAEGGDGADSAPAESDASTIQVDDLVDVCEGPFKGMQGPVLERTDDGGKAGLTLVLTVMGRDTPVTVPEDHCIRAAPST